MTQLCPDYKYFHNTINVAVCYKHKTINYANLDVSTVKSWQADHIRSLSASDRTV